MAQYFTDFEEYATGAEPSDWTKYGEATRVYNIVDIGGDEGKVMRGTYGATDTANTDFLWDAVAAGSADQEVLIRVRFTENTSTDWRVHLLGTGASPQANGYYHGYNEPGGSGTLSLAKRVSGSYGGMNTAAASALQTAIDAGDWVWFRAKIASGSHSLRAWVDGDAEPATWGVTASNSEITSGIPGIGQYRNTQFEVSYYSVGTAGDVAPEPAASASPLTLTPSGDGTVSGFEDQVGATTDLYAAVDEGVDTPDEDTTYIRNSGPNAATIFFNVSGVPADFSSINSLLLRTRLRRESEPVVTSLTSSGLHTHYKFDEGTGIVLNDSGPNTKHHDLGWNGSDYPAWVSGGLSFNRQEFTHYYPGSTRTANTNLSNSNYWTFHMLLKWDGTFSAAVTTDRWPTAMQSTITSSNRMIVQMRGDTGVPFMLCSIYNGTDYPGRWGAHLGNRLANETDWFVLTCTFDPTVGSSGGIMGATGMTGGMSMYLNGTKLTASDDEAMKSGSSTDWKFGGRTNFSDPANNEYGWEGEIGYFADFNRILSGSEIQNDYLFIKNEVSSRGIVLP